ncbi:hypothetical protein EMCRGX_G024400 [Ephydatia muelleri]
MKEKHPEPSQSYPQAFLLSTHLPTLTDLDITSAHIATAANRIKGSAGPGGSTATHWQAFLLHNGTHSAKLRDTVAVLARCLSNTIVDWKDIRALMSSCLIALDKSPGVCPIAIGEILRRIICRSIVMVTRTDIADLCGVNQLCSGVKGGIEGAFHAMKELFETNRASGWGLLLVDANNAFNSLNRVAAICIQWPRCARFVFNAYRGYAPLVVQKKPNAEFIFIPINSNMQSKLASEVDEAMASGMHDHSNSWHLATLAACFLDSAANAPTATLASLRVTGVRNDVTVTAAGFQGHLQGGSSAYAISHFDLHWEMGMSTEINKDVPQMVVPSNNISTMSAGGSMMTKWIKGNTRAKGAQRTACGI